MQKQKGFTIIELIVVIAIIAVLASIVLVNVTQYINKGKDAAAKGNLATLLVNGAQYLDQYGNYNDFTSADSYLVVYEALTSSNAGYTVIAGCNTADCVATATHWCAAITLKSGMKYCVDDYGEKIESATTFCDIGATGACSY